MTKQSRYSYTTSWAVGRRFRSHRRMAPTSRRCAGANLAIPARTWASADRRSAADWVLPGTSTSTWSERRPEGSFFTLMMAPWDWISAAEGAPRPPGDARGRRLFLLARLRRHREAFLNPRLPERCLAGDGSRRLIAVMVEVQRNHARAAAVEGAQRGYARPRLVEPQQGVVRIFGVVLHHAAERRDARGRRP